MHRNPPCSSVWSPCWGNIPGWLTCFCQTVCNSFYNKNGVLDCYVWISYYNACLRISNEYLKVIIKMRTVKNHKLFTFNFLRSFILPQRYTRIATMPISGQRFLFRLLCLYCSSCSFQWSKSFCPYQIQTIMMIHLLLFTRCPFRIKCLRIILLSNSSFQW